MEGGGEEERKNTFTIKYSKDHLYGGHFRSIVGEKYNMELRGPE